MRVESNLNSRAVHRSHTITQPKQYSIGNSSFLLRMVVENCFISCNTDTDEESMLSFILKHEADIDHIPFLFNNIANIKVLASLEIERFYVIAERQYQVRDSSHLSVTHNSTFSTGCPFA
jgi:hypothetical protein